MPTSSQRELMAQIQELGYTPQGNVSGNAILLRHPEAGSIIVHATPSDRRYEQNKLAEARRKIRQAHDKVGQFVGWLLEQNGVPHDGQKEIKVNVRKEAQRYLEQVGPNGGKLNTLSGQISKDGRVEILDRRQGQSETLLRLSGTDFLPEAPQTPAVPDALPEEYNTPPEPVLPESVPLDALLDLIRKRVEENGGEDVDTRIELAAASLVQAQKLIRDALDLLKEGRPRTAAGSPEPPPPPAS